MGTKGRRAETVDPGDVARGTAGFTIAELLVVIVVIAALVGVVIYSLNGISTHGQTNACRNEKRRVSAAIQQYQVEVHRYPPDVRALLRDSRSGKRYLDKSPEFYERIGPDGVVLQPLAGQPCHGI